MIFKSLTRKVAKPVTQPTQLWTEVNTKQQETMKGDYPWPGFPPKSPGGNR